MYHRRLRGGGGVHGCTGPTKPEVFTTRSITQTLPSPVLEHSPRPPGPRVLISRMEVASPGSVITVKGSRVGKGPRWGESLLPRWAGRSLLTADPLSPKPHAFIQKEQKPVQSQPSQPHPHMWPHGSLTSWWEWPAATLSDSHNYNTGQALPQVSMISPSLSFPSEIGGH